MATPENPDQTMAIQHGRKSTGDTEIDVRKSFTLT